MINIDLQRLVNALDGPTRFDLEGTAQRCMARGGSQILIEDLLLALLERPAGLLSSALSGAGVEAAEFIAALNGPLEERVARNPVFSPELIQWLQDALLVANLELGQACIEEAALILALLRNPMRYAGTRYQPLMSRIDADRLRDFVVDGRPAPAADPSGAPDGSWLARFTQNLTEQARQGKLDPVLCRDQALRQMIDILARRRKNNPIVVGEAGVGKSAVVEGLALRIAQGSVPESMQNVELLSLDMGSLQAGASIKGEFERRLKGLIDEIQASARPIILFIDEAHTLIGAGGQSGSNDAANLLKPALARGELRTIAATTWSEYRKYFEKDPALARRFQPVRLHEPTLQEATTVLRELAPLYGKTHGVYVRDDAVVAAAQLSARYLTGRQLPDKAVDLLDTACARVRINLAAVPECVERLRAQLAAVQREVDALTRDAAAGLPVDSQTLREREEELASAGAELALLEPRWEAQRTMAQRVLEVRQRLAAGHADEQDAGSLRQELATSMDALTVMQQGAPLVSFEVCPRLIAEVVSAWTGVPLSQLAREHSVKVASFATDLSQRIRGQDHAVYALDRAMRALAAGLDKPDAPAGVFLLVGPSGVGKTETALALADLLYGGERFLTTINMSEFQEKHTVSRLIGAPPGYVGYGEGGMLTEAVRHKPYSVVLLDEVEKADPEVMNLFYQIFDKGIANDGEGREIDFRNTLILMTSNLGSEQIERLCTGAETPTIQALESAVRPWLTAHFKPALLARMQVVPYFPLGDAVLAELVELKLQRLARRLRGRRLELTYSAGLLDCLAARCQQSESGARLLDRLLEQHVMPPIVDRLLEAMATGGSIERVHATVNSAGDVQCEFA